MAKKKGKINWIKIISVLAFIFAVISPFSFSNNNFRFYSTPLDLSVILISIIILMKAFKK